MRLRNGAFLLSAFHRIQKRNPKGFYCRCHHGGLRRDIDLRVKIFATDRLCLSLLMSQWNSASDCLALDQYLATKWLLGLISRPEFPQSCSQGQKLAWTVRAEREVCIIQEGCFSRGTTTVFVSTLFIFTPNS